jgi:hypothetical protein
VSFKYPAAETNCWDWLLFAAMLGTAGAVVIGLVWLVIRAVRGG